MLIFLRRGCCSPRYRRCCGRWRLHLTVAQLRRILFSVTCRTRNSKFFRGQGRSLYSPIAHEAWRHAQLIPECNQEFNVFIASTAMPLWVTRRPGSSKGQLHLLVVFLDGVSMSRGNNYFQRRAKDVDERTATCGVRQVIPTCSLLFFSLVLPHSECVPRWCGHSTSF